MFSLMSLMCSVRLQLISRLRYVHRYVIQHDLTYVNCTCDNGVHVVLCIFFSVKHFEDL